MNLTFELGNGEAKSLAEYVAQLVREGVTFKMNKVGQEVTVELTGGF